MERWRCRGVRGATTAARNDRTVILAATRELMERMIEANGIEEEDVASLILSTTIDLNADFPAVAVRALGWYDVAILCTHEMQVPGALERCIRVLIHWNTPRLQKEIRHVYLREARSLRPDRSSAPGARSNGRGALSRRPATAAAVRKNEEQGW